MPECREAYRASRKTASNSGRLGKWIPASAGMTAPARHARVQLSGIQTDGEQLSPVGQVDSRLRGNDEAPNTPPGAVESDELNVMPECSYRTSRQTVSNSGRLGKWIPASAGMTRPPTPLPARRKAHSDVRTPILPRRKARSDVRTPILTGRKARFP